MAATYPTTPVTFPARTDGTPFMASYINALQDEVAALEASLVAGGRLPSPHRLNADGHVIFDGGGASKGHMQESGGGAYLGSNLYVDGANNWLLDDPTVVGAHVQLFNGGMVFNSAQPGVGPRGLTQQGVIMADGSMRERGRTVAMGDWQTMPYAASNLTAGAGTWTLVPGNHLYQWCLIGSTCYINFVLGAGTLSASTPWIRFVLPVPNQFQQQGLFTSNVGGWQTGQYVLGSNVVTCYYTVGATTPWPAGTCYVTGNLIYAAAGL